MLERWGGGIMFALPLRPSANEEGALGGRETASDALAPIQVTPEARRSPAAAVPCCYRRRRCYCCCEGPPTPPLA